MELGVTERRGVKSSEISGQFLASRYAQLMRWAIALARNDRDKAEEIVQEFCLYLTLAKPDFSRVTNLNGYLYTCLRHIYTSSMARASRDALCLVSLEEYDSFAMAVAPHTPGDALQRQNDLRRACAFAVWRKVSSKTASYFILHFFHGYNRQEIADLARVTMATIYNKLKAARSEVGAHLQDEGKIRAVGNDPPSPQLSWHVVPVSELFTELRETILRARLTDCLPEQELRALYCAPGDGPIPCDLLAHIVSCERCLDVVDRLGRRPTLKDREPLDVFGYSPLDGAEKSKAGSERAYQRMMEVVQRKWERVRDHRPRSLSIALNGEVVVTHDVLAEHNRLSARIEAVDRIKFVEIFSEQDVRLALLSVEGTLPEVGVDQRLRIDLSDARWLELSLRFDGFGLESEVVYYDPTLSHTFEEENSLAVASVPAQPLKISSLLEVAWQRLSRLASPPMAWAFSMLVVAGLSYWFYSARQIPLQATTVMNHASQVEIAALRGQTEHQVVRLEASSPDGRERSTRIIDLWKDGDGSRYIRRLLDDHRQVLAVEWRGKGQGIAKQRTLRRLDGVAGQFWDQELSSRAFATIEDGKPMVQTIENGYEIIKAGPSPKYPQLVSATLVLNSRYEAVEQRLQVKTAHGVRQLRFIQESYEIKPSPSVSDGIFEVEGQVGRRGRTLTGPYGLTEENGGKLAELEISVLYALRTLNADTGVPIEVTRTPAGRVQVEGVVADDNLRRLIDTRLHGLTVAYLLDLKIAASGQVKAPARSSLRSGPMESYEVSQTRFVADAPVRHFLATRGLARDALNEAVEQFSRDALAHAQKALQHAYALNRLGSVVTSDELRLSSEQAQHEWTAMVQEHSSKVKIELGDLQKQLAAVWPSESIEQNTIGGAIEIENPSQYTKAAGRLLEQVSALNQRTGELFTANGSPSGEINQEMLLKIIMDTKALDDSSRMAQFAIRLRGAADGNRAATSNK